MYLLFAASPVSRYVVLVVVPICVNVELPGPSRSIRYPVTPTLSFDAFQVSSIWPGPTAAAVSLLGAVGGCVSDEEPATAAFLALGIAAKLAAEEIAALGRHGPLDHRVYAQPAGEHGAIFQELDFQFCRAPTASIRSTYT